MRSAQKQRALLVVVLGFVVFGAMAGLVATGKIEEDTAILGWLEGQRSSFWTSALVAITRLGTGSVTLTLTTVLCVWLFARKRRLDAAFLATANFGSAIISAAIKATFERQRPPIEIVNSVLEPQSFSFPSGHAMGAMVFYVSICIIGVHLNRPWRVLVLALALAMVPTMGFTRLYLGVHYPSDVVAGWALGAAWVSLSYLVLFQAWPAGRVASQRDRE